MIFFMDFNVKKQLYCLNMQGSMLHPLEEKTTRPEALK